jgi:RNA polymerase sigma factor (sigma-70 family)
MTPLADLFRRSAPDPRRDGDLVAAFLGRRDEGAFAELVRRHGPLVWGVCRRTLPDAADAEDAFQATFLVLVRRAGRMTAAGTVGPWLHRVAVLTARTARRKNARRLARFAPLPDAVPAPASAPPPADLDAALAVLSERSRAALLLCRLEGLTYREAADRLGCAEGTVASLVSRGLAKLRARFAGAELPALAVAVPAAVGMAAVRAAVSSRLASAVAAPAAVTLAREVLRVFWIRKATAAGVATFALLAAGFGAGLTLRHPPDAAGQEKAAVPPPPPPAGKAEAGPYIVFAVRGLTPGTTRPVVPEPFTITEFDAAGKCRWCVVPGGDLAKKWASGELNFGPDSAAVVRGARDYLTRVRKDAAAPRDLRLEIETRAPIGGFTLEAIKACVDAGFERFKVTGFVPTGGGFIPQLQIGPDGEAEGYKRYRGEEVDGKQFLADYQRMLRTL